MMRIKNDEDYILALGMYQQWEKRIAQMQTFTDALSSENAEQAKSFIEGMEAIRDDIAKDIDNYRIRLAGCVKCGYCCQKYQCSYGRWNAERGQCDFLNANLLCELYEEIVNYERFSQYPMFDNYCSSSLFNTVREAKIKEMEDEKEAHP